MERLRGGMMEEWSVWKDDGGRSEGMMGEKWSYCFGEEGEWSNWMMGGGRMMGEEWSDCVEG